MKSLTLREFLHTMPKLELHAHLNGCLKTDSILELGKALYGQQMPPEFSKLTQQVTDVQNLSHCFEKFKFMHQLTATKAGLELATLLVIRDFALDNVVYLELRTTAKSNEHMNKLEYLECCLKAIRQAREMYASISVKLLPSIDRSQSVAAAQETVAIVKQLLLHDEQADLIVGLDFSGNPAQGEFAQFMPVLAEAREHGLALTLHCGEVEAEQEINEMLQFGMSRCGHGTHLQQKHWPQLLQQQIAVECCLSSNIKCKTVPSYDAHHLQTLLAAKVPVVLCTDDCGVFDTTLTEEFILAAQTFKLHKTQLQQLSANAVQYAFARNAEKQQLLEQIEQFFETNEIVNL